MWRICFADWLLRYSSVGFKRSAHKQKGRLANCENSSCVSSKVCAGKSYKSSGDQGGWHLKCNHTRGQGSAYPLTYFCQLVTDWQGNSKKPVSIKRTFQCKVTQTAFRYRKDTYIEAFIEVVAAKSFWASCVRESLLYIWLRVSLCIPLMLASPCY